MSATKWLPHACSGAARLTVNSNMATARLFANATTYRSAARKTLACDANIINRIRVRAVGAVAEAQAVCNARSLPRSEAWCSFLCVAHNQSVNTGLGRHSACTLGSRPPPPLPPAQMPVRVSKEGFSGLVGQCGTIFEQLWCVGWHVQLI